MSGYTFGEKLTRARLLTQGGRRAHLGLSTGRKRRGRREGSGARRPWFGQARRPGPRPGRREDPAPPPLTAAQSPPATIRGRWGAGQTSPYREEPVMGLFSRTTAKALDNTAGAVHRAGTKVGGKAGGRAADKVNSRLLGPVRDLCNETCTCRKCR